MSSDLCAFYLIADDLYQGIACGIAKRLVKLWRLDVHVFLENSGDPVQDTRGNDRVFVHKNLLKGKRPDGLPATKNWPAIVYDRLFAPVLLQRYRRLIYLDADIYPMIMESSLLQIPLPGGLGAVQDSATVGYSPQAARRDRDAWRNSIGLKTDRYFNSGVLIIDTEAWSKIDFVHELGKFMRNHGSAVHMPDQDFLNWLFQDRWTELSPKFNYQKGLFNYGYEELFPPVFLHFSSFQKPWLGPDTCVSVQGQFHEHFRELIRAGGADPDQMLRCTSGGWLRRARKAVRLRMSQVGLSVNKEHRLRVEWEERANALFNGFKEDQAISRYADFDFTLSSMPRPKLYYDGQYLRRALNIKIDGESQ